MNGNETCHDAIKSYYDGLKTPVFLCCGRRVVWHNVAANELDDDKNFKGHISNLSCSENGEKEEFLLFDGQKYRLLIRPFEGGFYVEVWQVKSDRPLVCDFMEMDGAQAMDGVVRKSSHQILQSAASLSSSLERLEQYDALRALDDVYDGTYRVLRASSLYYEYSLLLREKMDMEVVDIFGEIDALCCSIKSIMHKSPTPFSWTVPNEKLFCKTDMHKLSFALFHLICNSYCFSSQGNQIEVIVDRLHGEQLHIQVVDRGLGVLADDLEKIFEPFYSYDSSTGDAAGCGLGLTYASVLAQKLGGSFEFSSSGGKTVASIMIPIELVSDLEDFSSHIVEYGACKYDFMVSTMVTLEKSRRNIRFA